MHVIRKHFNDNKNENSSIREHLREDENNKSANTPTIKITK